MTTNKIESATRNLESAAGYLRNFPAGDPDLGLAYLDGVLAAVKAATEQLKAERRRIAKPKVKRGEPCAYSFRWVCGGYNTVFACSREEAIAKARDLGRLSLGGMTRTLVPDLKTLKRDPSGRYSREYGKGYGWSMFD